MLIFRCLFCTILIFALNYNVHAQKYKFGGKVSLSASSVSGNYNTKYANRLVSPSIGGIINIAKDYKSCFSLLTEFNITVKGANFKFPDSTGRVIVKDVSRFYYLEAPVMLKYTNKRNYFVNGGVYGGYLIGGYDKKRSSGELIANGSKWARGSYSNFDYGIVAGIGKFLPSGVFVEIRYSRGLANVSMDSKLKNNCIQASVGYFMRKRLPIYNNYRAIRRSTVKYRKNHWSD